MKKFFLFILYLCAAMNSPLFGNLCNQNQAVLILLGSPGSGKGTQAVYLREKYRVAHVATGDLFRENLKNNTEIGKKAKSYMEKGALVPDEIVIDMVLERLKMEDCKSGFILDGFPRTLSQALILEKHLNGCNVIVLNIDVPDDVIIERLSGRLTCEKCGTPFHKKFNKPKVTGICDQCQGALIHRKDDLPEVVKTRLKVYHEQTEPLIAYYQKRGVLHWINGKQSKEEISDSIARVIHERASS